MYWTLKSIPELQDLPPRQRRLIWNAARAKRIDHIPYVALFACMMFLAFGGNFVKSALHDYPARLIAIAAAMLVIAAIYHQWRISKLRPITWEFIPGLCRHCAQRIPAAADGCPACRAPIQPHTPCPEAPIVSSVHDGFYWTTKSIPELKGLPASERKQIWKTVIKKAGRRTDVLFLSLALSMAPMIFTEFIGGYRILGKLTTLLFMAAIICSQILYWQWYISILRPLMWEHLPGLCPHCGYNLKATPDRCPECGADVTSTTALRDDEQKLDVQ